MNQELKENKVVEEKRCSDKENKHGQQGQNSDGRRQDEDNIEQKIKAFFKRREQAASIIEHLM